MRKFVLVCAALVALPLAAQNVDIEALSGLQFNFGNPGARSLGMGGAFLGLADDASAAEANPAGLSILRKPEFSIELRNYEEQQLFSTSGTFPDDVVRTPFTHYSNRVVPTFASAVFPVKKFTFGAYYHEPLNNKGGGVVFPTFNEFTGAQETALPNFYLPAGGGDPISETECDKRNLATPGSCVEFRIDPFISALDVRQRTFGIAGAWQVHPKFSVGATARYQRFREAAFTFRFDTFFNPSTVSVQATAKADGEDVTIEEVSDVTFAVGFKWAPSDKFSVGGVYKKGPEFDTPLFFAGAATDNEFLQVADTKFHIPDIAGVGVSYRPIPVLTINVDAVRVKYSNLTDDFVASVADVRGLTGDTFEAADVTELHVGAEYFFSTKIPVAIRAGFWRDPAHSVTWRGPLTNPNFIAEALLYPEGEAQNHFSIGAGLAWPRFQIDAAYDSSENYKVASLSMVTRF
ncbi:MAG TPA: outer membrane protein transport protein [Thermoanaerobaculia bacterium]|nr:outer membrane protein transport protein [Thermoanaerobaculia bacterium]